MKKSIIQLLWVPSDIRAAYSNDPALRWKIFWFLELLTYPWVWAIVFHRFSHVLYVLKIPFLPRLISQILRFLTWIEIHPWAFIWSWFFIDHWMWVVIWETAQVWNNVLMYHQVTLWWTSLNSWKRHPTIWNNVLIWAWAKLFWPIVIWDDTQIGWWAIVFKNVESHCVVVWNPWRVVKRHWKKIAIQEVNQINMPDPIWNRLNKIEEKLNKISVWPGN